MKPLSLFTAISLTAAFASAAPGTYKDWTSGEGTDEVHGVDSCWIATSVATGTHRAQMILSAPKDGLTLPQVLVKIWGAKDTEARLQAPASSKTFHNFLLWKKAAAADDANVYWYAPVAMTKLIDTIEGANTLAITGTEVQSKVSLKGSSDAVSAWKRCLKKVAAVPEDFLKKLNVKATIDQAAFATTQETIDGLERAFVVYRDGMTATKELTDLRASAKKELSREKDALDTYNSALKRWQTVSDNLANQRAKEAAMQKTLAETQADLAAKQVELPIAQQDLEVKTATYKPVRAQMDPLFKEVDQRQDALDSNISETARLQRRVANIPGEISSLRSERSRLDSQIQSLDWDISRARRDYDDAESAYSRYNVDSEFRSEFERDAQAGWARSAIQRARSEMQSASSQRSSAQSALSSAQSALNSCHAVTPAKDCSSEQNAVNNAQAQLNQAQQRCSQAENEIRSNEWTLQMRESSIRSDKERVKRDLQSKADDLERKWRSLQSEQDSARARRNAIDDEIPDLQAELARAKAKIPVLQAAKPGLEAALADAQQRRDALAAQIDYVRIEKEYRDAIARVDRVKKAIKDDTALIAKTQKDLKQIAPVIAALVKDEAAKMKTRDAAAAKLAPIQEALKPFRAKETALTDKIKTLADEFEVIKARFQKATQAWFA